MEWGEGRDARVLLMTMQCADSAANAVQRTNSSTGGRDEYDGLVASVAAGAAAMRAAAGQDREG
jgi:hypothetical protein